MLLPSVSNQKLESQLFSPHVKARINLRSTVQILQKWGSCTLAPLRYIKNPSHCMSCLFSSLHIGGGGGHYSFLHLEIYFPEKKKYCCCHSRCNCRKKRNMFGDTYFLWSIRLKNENPKNQRVFFTGKWIHSSFLSHKWLFFFSSVLCLFFACWYLFLVDMSVFVLCLLRFFDVFCPFVLCLCRCLVFACRFKPMTLVFCM